MLAWGESHGREGRDGTPPAVTGGSDSKERGLIAVPCAKHSCASRQGRGSRAHCSQPRGQAVTNTAVGTKQTGIAQEKAPHFTPRCKSAAPRVLSAGSCVTDSLVPGSVEALPTPINLCEHLLFFFFEQLPHYFGLICISSTIRRLKVTS